jgi:hypothetical protein
MEICFLCPIFLKIKIEDSTEKKQRSIPPTIKNGNFLMQSITPTSQHTDFAPYFFFGLAVGMRG